MQKVSGLSSAAAQLHAFLNINIEWLEQHRLFLLPYVQYRLSEPLRVEAEQRTGLERLFAHFIRLGQTNGEFAKIGQVEVLAERGNNRNIYIAIT